jgi:hypothetical protein
VCVCESKVLRKMSEVKKKESFTHFAQLLAEGQGVEGDDEVWYVSNASDHMTPRREWFTTFEEVPEGDWSVGELDGSQHWGARARQHQNPAQAGPAVGGRRVGECAVCACAPEEFVLPWASSQAGELRQLR